MFKLPSKAEPAKEKEAAATTSSGSDKDAKKEKKPDSDKDAKKDKKDKKDKGKEDKAPAPTEKTTPAASSSSTAGGVADTSSLDPTRLDIRIGEYIL